MMMYEEAFSTILLYLSSKYIVKMAVNGFVTKIKLLRHVILHSYWCVGIYIYIYVLVYALEGGGGVI
jgi:hypothetical protein